MIEGCKECLTVLRAWPSNTASRCSELFLRSADEPIYCPWKIPTIPQGHEYLVNSAFELAGDNELVIAIGSASKGWESNNPWTIEERTAMVKSWLKQQNKSATIVGINDINDPQIGLIMLVNLTEKEYL